MAASAPRGLVIAKMALLYFAIVFAAGFVLGAFRTLFVVSYMSTRSAELLEAPLMLAVVFIAARWLTLRVHLPNDLVWLAIGSLALAVMLLTEFTVVLSLRGLSLAEYFATRDPISGGVYFASLGVFAVCPWLVARARTRLRAHGNSPAA